MNRPVHIPQSIQSTSDIPLLSWEPGGDREPGSVMVASGILGPRSWIVAGPQIATATERACLTIPLPLLPIDPASEDVIAQCAAATSSFVQEFDPRILVGHAFAGPLLLAMMADDAIRPPGVTGLVLINSMLPVKMRQVPKFAGAVKGAMPEVPQGVEDDQRARVELFLDTFVVRPDAISPDEREFLLDTPPNPPADADRIRELQKAVGAATTRLAFGKGISDLLKACPVPITILMGDSDPLVPTFLADNLSGRGAISGVTVEVLKDCGQFGHIDATSDLAHATADLVNG